MNGIKRREGKGIVESFLYTMLETGRRKTQSLVY